MRSVRRRSRLPRTATVGLSIVGLVLAWVGTTTSGQSDPVTDAPRRALAAATTLLPGTRSPAVPGRPNGAGQAASGSRQAAADAQAFASVRDLALMLPHPDPMLVAFHEASRPEALPIHPFGRLLSNDNPTKFTATEDMPGPHYWVLSSRGRTRPATSAVDIVVPEGALIAAPVSGRVVEVREYPLYHQTRDWRVAIKPTSHPGLEVVLIHLERPRVEVGDEVIAGETPLAVARLLGFTSHVDYVTQQHLPHTHIEVKLAVGPEALDPNAPAVEPNEAPISAR